MSHVHVIPELGVIEGYFGRPWPHEERKRVLSRLHELGYAWFHHAPKADPFLRRRWREPHPDAALAQLSDLSAHCRQLGLRFGLGLSPYELYRDFSTAARAAFIAKVRALDAIGIDDLAILFDDTRGDLPDLATREAEIVHTAMANTRASRVLMCPTYYCDDRMLDLVFGVRPPGYLQELGRRLDPRVAVYWTGEEVCTREFGRGHLARVAEALGRKPTLWDNYPVNDGPRMSRFLHLRGFTGRGTIGDCVAAHAINPALQPQLSLIPAATLGMSYREGSDYRYMAAFRTAARALAGDEFADLLEQDLHALQDRGIDQLDDDDRVRLRERYASVTHPMAAEIVRFLDGAYTTDGWLEDV
jgi:hypothetical protein